MSRAQAAMTSAALFGITTVRSRHTPQVIVARRVTRAPAAASMAEPSVALLQRFYNRYRICICGTRHVALQIRSPVKHTTYACILLPKRALNPMCRQNAKAPAPRTKRVKPDVQQRAAGDHAAAPL